MRGLCVMRGNSAPRWRSAHGRDAPAGRSTVVMTVRLAFVGLLAGFSPAQEVPAAEGDRLGRVLPLCNSPDPVARRFCIDEIRALGDPERRARTTLLEMAAGDADVG